MVPKRSGWQWFGGVFGVAAALRFVCAVWVLRGHQPAWFFAQASELRCMAESIAAGRGLGSPFCVAGEPSAFLPPLYPLLVGTVFRLCGGAGQAAECVLLALQVSFALATGVVLYAVARKIAGQRVALVALGLWALAPPLWFLPCVFWDSALSQLVLALLVACAVCCVDDEQREKPWPWAAFGVLVAGTQWLNPALLPSGVALFAMAAWRHPAQWRKVALSALLALALMMPWVIRNAVVLHAFVPLRSNFGYELWQGNRAGADGFFQAWMHPNRNPAELAEYARAGELPYMREKGREAKQEIARRPARFALLSAKRVVWFWGGVEREASRFNEVYACVVTWLAAVGFLMALLRRHSHAGASEHAAAANRRGVQRWTWLLLAVPMFLFPLPYYVTHPDFRFRLLLDPWLFMFAALALVRGFAATAVGRKSRSR